MRQAGHNHAARGRRVLIRPQRGRPRAGLPPPAAPRALGHQHDEHGEDGEDDVRAPGAPTSLLAMSGAIHMEGMRVVFNPLIPECYPHPWLRVVSVRPVGWYQERGYITNYPHTLIKSSCEMGLMEWYCCPASLKCRSAAPARRAHWQERAWLRLKWLQTSGGRPSNSASCIAGVSCNMSAEQIGHNI